MEKDDEENGVGVFNGDIGEIIFIDKSIGRVKIRYDDRVADYSVDMMSELELAYAVTVHKKPGQRVSLRDSFCWILLTGNCTTEIFCIRR